MQDSLGHTDMSRIIILAAIAAAIWWWLRKQQASKAATATKKPASLTTERCAYCGTYMPQEKAVCFEQKFFCEQKHLNLWVEENSDN